MMRAPTPVLLCRPKVAAFETKAECLLSLTGTSKESKAVEEAPQDSCGLSETWSESIAAMGEFTIPYDFDALTFPPPGNKSMHTHIVEQFEEHFHEVMASPLMGRGYKMEKVREMVKTVRAEVRGVKRKRNIKESKDHEQRGFNPCAKRVRWTVPNSRKKKKKKRKKTLARLMSKLSFADSSA